jgi:hypothetical protein
MPSLEDLVALEPISLSKPNELYRCVLTHKILRYSCNVVNKKMHRPATERAIATLALPDDLYFRAGVAGPANAVFRSKQKFTNSGV